MNVALDFVILNSGLTQKLSLYSHFSVPSVFSVVSFFIIVRKF
jgi:hypothetical protein